MVLKGAKRRARGNHTGNGRRQNLIIVLHDEAGRNMHWNGAISILFSIQCLIPENEKKCQLGKSYIPSKDSCLNVRTQCHACRLSEDFIFIVPIKTSSEWATSCTFRQLFIRKSALGGMFFFSSDRRCPFQNEIFTLSPFRLVTLFVPFSSSCVLNCHPLTAFKFRQLPADSLSEQ